MDETTTTSVDDLFGDDAQAAPKAAKPAKPTRAPRPPAKPKPEVRVETVIRGGGKIDGPRLVAHEPIDNAVNIRRLDWECECGNTNTLDLQMCGKCRKQRFTH